ncbi:MAG: ROK family protein [Syntrophobacteraceae bacterium]
MGVNERVDDTVYIGVDIGGTNLRSALVDGSGNILEMKKDKCRIDLGARSAAETLAAQCLGLARSAEDRGLVLGAIGVGVAGKIDKAAETVVFSPNLPPLDGYPLGIELGKRTGSPVFMENDANVFGLGESFAGAAKGIDNWAGMTLGTGVGGCLILGGALWEGDGLGFCAEIGHVIIQPDGPPCACGSKGCLESFSSATALVKGAKRLVREGGMREGMLFELWRENALSADTIYECAKKGDGPSLSLFETMGWALGVAISNLFSVLGIRHAVIGGGVSAAWDVFIGPLEASLAHSISMLDPELAVIRRSALGDDAALIGAARVAQIGLRGQAK